MPSFAIYHATSSAANIDVVEVWAQALMQNASNGIALVDLPQAATPAKKILDIMPLTFTRLMELE